MSPPSSPSSKPPKPGTRSLGFRAQKATGQSATPGVRITPNPTNPGNPVNPLAAPSSPTAPVAMNRRNAPPMKKRAKGSGFLALVFMTGFATVAYFIWSQLLQFQSYGMIDGRVIAVAAPWDGTVANWQVRDGEVVRQGQVLAKISNLDMEHKLATLGDELKMHQALLEAEISKIKFDVQTQSDRSREAVALYLKSYGELLAEKAKCRELDLKLKRTKMLAMTRNVSRAAYEQAYFQLAGQKKMVDKLEDAVEVLRIRCDSSNQNDDDGSSRLRPILAEIELTEAKTKRLRERIDQGHIKSPVNGRVSKRLLLTGESAKDGEPVIEILEDDSIEAVLYVPQRIVDEFEIGNEISISIEPYDQPLKCIVDRFGDRFQLAPTSLKRYYYEGQPLLPVYLSPDQGSAQAMAMRIGSTVKRPYEYGKAVGKILDHVMSNFRSSSPSSGTGGTPAIGVSVEQIESEPPRNKPTHPPVVSPDQRNWEKQAVITVPNSSLASFHNRNL